MGKRPLPTSKDFLSNGDDLVYRDGFYFVRTGFGSHWLEDFDPTLPRTGGEWHPLAEVDFARLAHHIRYGNVNPQTRRRNETHVRVRFVGQYTTLTLT